MSRLPRFAGQENLSLLVAYITGVTGLVWHTWTFWFLVVAPAGISLSIGNTASFVGLQLALTALVGASSAGLRGLCGGLLLLAAVAALLTVEAPSAPGEVVTWPIRAHVLISLFAYGLLAIGAIVACFALIQDRRLRAGTFTSANRLFAPLETTETLLFGLTTAGFLMLLIAVSSGFAFVENLFAQHLVHKTVLSLLALAMFGVLLAGRHFAGWRGRRAVYLYLWGFLILCLAYFGSRYILEEILGRSWS